MLAPNEQPVTAADQLACTDPWEQAERTAGNQQKLAPLTTFIANKIASQLADPKDRLNLYSCCHFMNSLAAPANCEDQNGLYKLELYIIYNVAGNLIDHPRIRIQVNNRMTMLTMDEVIPFLNTLRGFFGAHVGLLMIGGRWTNITNGLVINAHLHIQYQKAAQILAAWGEITRYIIEQFVPQELELHLCSNTAPDAREFLANTAFVQRLKGLAIRFRSLAAPYNMCQLVRNMVIALGNNGVHLEKLFLQDEHADERAVSMGNVAPAQLVLYRKQTIQAIQAHANTLKRLDTDWLLGFDQESFDGLINTLDHLQHLRLMPSPEIQIAFNELFAERPDIAQQITELDLTLNSFESNNLLLTLAARFPLVQNCRLNLYRQSVAEADGVALAQQIQANYTLVVELINTLFNENRNQTMVLRIRGPGIMNRKIVILLTNGYNEHLLIASVSLGAQVWLYKMKPIGEDVEYNTQIHIRGANDTYGRKENTVQILLE